MKNLTSGSSRLKGFTLIELVIVIGIIGILAGISSMVVGGFRRGALIETNNKRAQIVYAAFQNILLDCEIKQDDSMFKPDSASSSDRLTSAIITFHVARESSSGVDYGETRIGDAIGYECVWTDGTTETKESGDWNSTNSGDRYDDLVRAIRSNMDSQLEGSYAVFIDFDNYIVDSVMCRALQSGKDPTMNLNDPNLYPNCFKDQSKYTNYDYYVIKNMMIHKKYANLGSAEYGCYPYLIDIDATAGA